MVNFYALWRMINRRPHPCPLAPPPPSPSSPPPPPSPPPSPRISTGKNLAIILRDSCVREINPASDSARHAVQFNCNNSTTLITRDLAHLRVTRGRHFKLICALAWRPRVRVCCAKNRQASGNLILNARCHVSLPWVLIFYESPK